MKVSIPKEYEKICEPKNVADIINTILKTESELDRVKEHFWVIGLNCQNKIKIIELIGIGTNDQCVVYPKEVFRTLLHYSCASFICAHNHPSGSKIHSEQDIKLIKRLKEGSDYMDFLLIDSVIVTNNDYESAREKNIL